MESGHTGFYSQNDKEKRVNIESYEYLTGNMIILVDMQVVSSWGEVHAEEDDI